MTSNKEIALRNAEEAARKAESGRRLSVTEQKRILKAAQVYGNSQYLERAGGAVKSTTKLDLKEGTPSAAEQLSKEVPAYQKSLGEMSGRERLLLERQAAVYSSANRPLTVQIQGTDISKNQPMKESEKKQFVAAGYTEGATYYIGGQPVSLDLSKIPAEQRSQIEAAQKKSFGSTSKEVTLESGQVALQTTQTVPPVFFLQQETVTRQEVVPQEEPVKKYSPVETKVPLMYGSQSQKLSGTDQPGIFPAKTAPYEEAINKRFAIETGGVLRNYAIGPFEEVIGAGQKTKQLAVSLAMQTTPEGRRNILYGYSQEPEVRSTAFNAGMVMLGEAGLATKTGVVLLKSIGVGFAGRGVIEIVKSDYKQGVFGEQLPGVLLGAYVTESAKVSEGPYVLEPVNLRTSYDSTTIGGNLPKSSGPKGLELSEQSIQKIKGTSLGTISNEKFTLSSFETKVKTEGGPSVIVQKQTTILYDVKQVPASKGGGYDVIPKKHLVQTSGGISEPAEPLINEIGVENLVPKKKGVLSIGMPEPGEATIGSMEVKTDIYSLEKLGSFRVKTIEEAPGIIKELLTTVRPESLRRVGTSIKNQVYNENLVKKLEPKGKGNVAEVQESEQVFRKGFQISKKQVRTKVYEEEVGSIEITNPYDVTTNLEVTKTRGAVIQEIKGVNAIEPLSSRAFPTSKGTASSQSGGGGGGGGGYTGRQSQGGGGGSSGAGRIELGRWDKMNARPSRNMMLEFEGMQYSGAQALSSGSIITHLQKGIPIRIEIPAERGQVFTGTPHGITSKEINPSSIRNVSATSSKVSSSVASRTESELISSEKATQRNRNFSMTPQLSREYTMPRVASISKSSQITEQETSQLQKQTLTQKQWTGIRLITPQETVTEPLALRMTGNITRRPNTQVIGVGGAEGKKESSFFAEVRRKKKFFTLGTFETKESAVKAGQTSVLTSAAASFRVSGAHGVLSFEEIGRPQSMNKAFYASAKEKGVVIQKRETRISSPGEKKEITYKGLNILRMRRR